MWHQRFLKICAMSAVLMTAATAHAQQRQRDDWRPENRTEWESLGSAEIGTRLERDVIRVGRSEGRFRSIGFTVTGSDVRIEDLTIVYAGGVTDNLPIKEFFKAGSRSRPIDLPGRAQVIEQIEVTYRSPGAVKIEFFGEKRREVWDQLGCQDVRFLEPNDVIRVGRREGAFNAIKLQVSNSTLRLMRLRVVFGDGSAQTLDVRASIPAGAETPPIDLDGRRRIIDRVELEYVPSLRLKRGAQVCVLAREGGRGFGGPGGPGDRGGYGDRGGGYGERGDGRGDYGGPEGPRDGYRDRGDERYRDRR